MNIMSRFFESGRDTESDLKRETWIIHEQGLVEARINNTKVIYRSRASCGSPNLDRGFRGIVNGTLVTRLGSGEKGLNVRRLSVSHSMRQVRRKPRG